MPAYAGFICLCSYYIINMQTLATIRKTCKNGRISTWHFVKTPVGDFVAFGGVDKEMKCFPSEAEAHKCFHMYLGYGYSRLEMPKPAVQQLELNLIG